MKRNGRERETEIDLSQLFIIAGQSASFSTLKIVLKIVHYFRAEREKQMRSG